MTINIADVNGERNRCVTPSDHVLIYFQRVSSTVQHTTNETCRALILAINLQKKRFILDGDNLKVNDIIFKNKRIMRNDAWMMHDFHATLRSNVFQCNAFSFISFFFNYRQKTPKNYRGNRVACASVQLNEPVNGHGWSPATRWKGVVTAVTVDHQWHVSK